MTTRNENETARMQPCCLAVSTDADVRSNPTAGGTRRWRALSLDTHAELATGDLPAREGDALALVRERAAQAARARGYEPQAFVLEEGESGR